MRYRVKEQVRFRKEITKQQDLGYVNARTKAMCASVKDALLGGYLIFVLECD